MKTIFKYPVPITDKFSMKLPEGAEILTFQAQSYSSQSCIWAIVNPDAKKETRYFNIVGTGHPIENRKSLKYIGTSLPDNGIVVWHLFEEVKSN